MKSVIACFFIGFVVGVIVFNKTPPPSLSKIKGLVINRDVRIENNFIQFTEILFENGTILSVDDLVLDLGKTYSFSHYFVDIKALLDKKDLITASDKIKEINFNLIEKVETQEPEGLDLSTIDVGYSKDSTCSNEQYNKIRASEFYKCHVSSQVLHSKKLIVETCTDIIGFLKDTNPLELFKIPEDDWIILSTRFTKGRVLTKSFMDNCNSDVSPLLGENYLIADQFVNQKRKEYEFNLYYLEN